MSSRSPSGDRPAQDGRASISRRAARLKKRLTADAGRLFESKWIWSLIFLAVLAPLIVTPYIGPALPVPPAGSVAPDDIVAPASREFEDDVATQELRRGARQAVPPVHEIDREAGSQAIATVRRLFEEGRRFLKSDLPSGSGGGAARDSIQAFLHESEFDTPPESIAYLIDVGFDPEVESRSQASLEETLGHRVIGSRTLLPRSGRVTLHDTRTGRQWREAPLGDAFTLDEARQLALRTLRDAGASDREIHSMAPLLFDLIAPNVIFNSTLTDAQRDEAAARIEPLIVRIPKGKVLVRRGEQLTEETVRILESFNRARDVRASGTAILGNLLLLSLLLFFMSRYVFFYQKSYHRERHLFALMVVIMVLGLLLDYVFQWLVERVVDNLHVEPFANAEFYRFMIPMAVGSMLVTLLVNARVGMAYALFYVPLFGVLMEWDLALLLFCLLSNLAAIYGITAYLQRTALIKAGILLGAVNAVAVLALQSVMGHQGPLSHLLFQMLCGFIGGILVAAITSFVLPLLESLFNILTDVRLLELSNLNNPLLRRLAVEAPGSYNHSVLVGTLAEAAAEAIGANALFCRVGAYYHDVGKMLKPTYFIENQMDDSNRHDRLSPHMSAIVIASHVKEGLELARSYGLPQQIADIIPQHHGTRKIDFFYQKAKTSENPALEEVRESDFRYPGPKPQTREAAIFMMADAIEAAARTLDDSSPARYKGLIQRIVSDIVRDDQFSDCDLTFSDLEKAKTSFLKTLCSIYHHRVDYPGFDFDKVEEQAIIGSRANHRTSPRAK